ncbi:MAG: GntR family transcriptional regulator [Longimicrobiales bacterium]
MMAGQDREPASRARLRTTAPGATSPGRGAAGTHIERQTVTGQVLEALRDRILSGAYAEEAPLRQDAVAAELGVSRIPVREALRQLEAEGLVAFNPHCGAVVSSLSLSEIEELFELRGLVESELIKEAVPLITPEDLARGDAILDAYEAAFERRDISEWGALNWRYHSTLLSAANRPLTLGILHKLHNQSDRYTRMQLALTHGEDRATGEHREIAAAVRAGRADHASVLLRKHIVDAGRSLMEFLRVHRDQTAALRALAGR